MASPAALDPTPSPFIHQQDISPKLDRKHDCFGLAKVQVLAELLYPLPIVCGCYYQPRHGEVDRGRQVALGAH